MNKIFATLTISAMVMAGASAQTEAEAIEYGAFLPYTGNYNNVTLDGVENIEWKTSNKSIESILSDGTSVSLEVATGCAVKYQASRTDRAWVNTEALNELNAAAGLSLTCADIDSMRFVGASGYINGTTSLTISFPDTKTSNELCFYIFAHSTKNKVTDFSIDGLSNISITTASNNGSGFNGKKTSWGGSTLFKIEGTMTSDSVTFTTADGNKAGFGLAAYTVVPEPATATLSLLALAGLAARRRRK